MKSNASFLHTASRMLILAGLLSVVIGLFTLVYPPSGDGTSWGHPFHQRTHVVVAVLLVIAHLLKAVGFIGLAGMAEGSRVIRWSLLLAVLGFVVVAACEGISATLFGVSMDSDAAVDLGNGYGAGSMLLAVPSMIGGVLIVRKRLLVGAGRWSVFLSGAFMVFVVTPILFMGRDWPAYLALVGWSLFYLWIGIAMNRTLSGGNAEG